jgi:hypothetical protein
MHARWNRPKLRRAEAQPGVRSGPRSGRLEPVGHSEVLRLLAKRNIDIGNQRSRVVSRMHSMLVELAGGGIAKEIRRSRSHLRSSSPKTPPPLRLLAHASRARSPFAEARVTRRLAHRDPAHAPTLSSRRFDAVLSRVAADERRRTRGTNRASRDHVGWGREGHQSFRELSRRTRRLRRPAFRAAARRRTRMSWSQTKGASLGDEDLLSNDHRAACRVGPVLRPSAALASLIRTDQASSGRTRGRAEVRSPGPCCDAPPGGAPFLTVTGAEHLDGRMATTLPTTTRRQR